MNKKITKYKLTGFKRLRFFGIIALVTMIAIGIVAAVSAQIGTVNKIPAQTKSVANKSNKNFQQADQTNDQTGQVRPLTAQEAQKLADGIKELVNQSDEGLVEVVNSDGSSTTDLQGRFQNIAVAKKNADGTASQSCLDNTQSAASFFGINPEKFGDKSKKGSPVIQSERDANGDEIK